MSGSCTDMGRMVGKRSSRRNKRKRCCDQRTGQKFVSQFLKHIKAPHASQMYYNVIGHGLEVFGQKY
jgi:hypothetical protein